MVGRVPRRCATESISHRPTGLVQVVDVVVVSGLLIALHLFEVEGVGDHLEDVNQLLLHFELLVVGEQVTVNHLRYLVATDVVDVACETTEVTVHALELNNVVVYLFFATYLGLFGGGLLGLTGANLVAHDDVMGVEDRLIEILLAVLDQSHQEVEAHLFG